MLAPNCEADNKRLKEQLRSARHDAEVIDEIRNELACLLSRCKYLRLFDNEIGDKRNETIQNRFHRLSNEEAIV
jgi:hypothetical protein